MLTLKTIDEMRKILALMNLRLTAHERHLITMYDNTSDYIKELLVTSDEIVKHFINIDCDRIKNQLIDG